MFPLKKLLPSTPSPCVRAPPNCLISHNCTGNEIPTGGAANEIPTAGTGNYQAPQQLLPRLLLLLVTEWGEQNHHVMISIICISDNTLRLSTSKLTRSGTANMPSLLQMCRIFTPCFMSINVPPCLSFRTVLQGVTSPGAECGGLHGDCQHQVHSQLVRTQQEPPLMRFVRRARF